MRKIALLLFVLIIVIYQLNAEPVDTNRAKKIAVNFYMQSTNNKSLNHADFALNYVSKARVQDVQKGEINSALYYIFNAGKNAGFVIVSADDRVEPILGYSFKGGLNYHNIPPAFKDLAGLYEKQIKYSIENNQKTNLDLSNKWKRIEKGEPLNLNKKIQSVDSLLVTTWNQYPYENAMCPADASGPGGHCVTGCVATAMAQIMKFWGFPAQGTGFHSYSTQNYGTLTADFGSTTYDWTSMPDNLYGPNQAVALLMYQCGVSVDMDYGPDGSGSCVIEADSSAGGCPGYAQYALINYFGYASTMQGLTRDDYSDASWLQLLKDEINASRP